MTFYHNFLGIDIGKFDFHVSRFKSNKQVVRYDNNLEGINSFLEDYAEILPEALSILEPTGGHERELLYSLLARNYPVHRTDVNKVKNFIRSFGILAKTDNIDAAALAKYGSDRHEDLELFKPNSKNANKLYQLVARRGDLTKALIAEKNRYQSPSEEVIKDSCANMIKHLQAEIEALKAKIEELIESCEGYRYKRQVLQEIPGVGKTVATDILAFLPELGEINRRQIASLTGLAPVARDSGTYRGYRRVNHGRSNLKPSLFLAAMGARKCIKNSYLKEFYEKLINESGKKKMVALTAVMRKIIIIANAKIKNVKLAQNHG